jgi:KDO2-lipid IV(A) lauroyltransferase
MPSTQKTMSNSSLALRLGMAYARLLPPRLAIPLNRQLARYIASRRTWKVVQGARLNQAVVRGLPLASPALDQALHSVFTAQANALYDMFRYLAYPQEMQQKLIEPPALQELYHRSQHPEPGKGVIVAGIHLSNFDMAMHMLTRSGLHALVITLAELPGAYQAQYEQRRSAGVEVVTASVSTFRQAIQRLKQGGVVATGIDRPIPEIRHRPLFFGQPAPLPTHHITLALKAQVPIVLMAVHREPDGSYPLYVSEPIHLQPDPADRERELTHNAGLVLSHAEPLIRQYPEQWAMFLPVWPELALHS